MFTIAALCLFQFFFQCGAIPLLRRLRGFEFLSPGPDSSSRSLHPCRRGTLGRPALSSEDVPGSVVSTESILAIPAKL